jgi:trehalose 6-phosphate synthase
MPSSRDTSPAPGQQREQRLIVVSNRLPVTISKDDKGEYHFKVSVAMSAETYRLLHMLTFQMSSGGLVSALSGCKKTMSFTWIGWPGQDVCTVHDLADDRSP